MAARNACLMTLVIRSNYGDDSISLIEVIRQKISRQELANEVYVVYIETGWAAEGWIKRVEQGEAFAKSCGFTALRLKPKAAFPELIKERNSFPTKKFQWCTGFLKGLPLLEWLDERDPAGEWLIALPKRQALYRKTLEPHLETCAYHGERAVWHPILSISNEQRDEILAQVGFLPLNHRSLECHPCVNSRYEELTSLSEEDKAKSVTLERTLHKPLFPQWGYVDQLKDLSCPHSTPASFMDAFSMGCGDPFGCGL